MSGHPETYKRKMKLYSYKGKTVKALNKTEAGDKFGLKEPQRVLIARVK